MPPLDFPASPSTGQTYAGPGGAVWSWDGAKWVNGASASAVVSSFNTRTGAVTLSSGDVTTALTFTPYNSTNPSGYQTAANVTTALAAGSPGAFSTLSASGAVSGAGFTSLLTPYAALASPSFTGTPTAPTVAATASAGTTQVATTAFARNGTTTNDNALAGQIGEYVSSNVPVGSAVALTTAVIANVTSISLTAGDWDVGGNVIGSPTGTTTIAYLAAAISLVSATLPTRPNGGAFAEDSAAHAAPASIALPTGQMRLSLSATTTVWLVAYAQFAASTLGAYGFIGARRAR